MREFVMDAMRCNGLAADTAKSSGPAGGKMELRGLGAGVVEPPPLPAPLLLLLLCAGVPAQHHPTRHR